VASEGVLPQTSRLTSSFGQFHPLDKKEGEMLFKQMTAKKSNLAIGLLATVMAGSMLFVGAGAVNAASPKPVIDYKYFAAMGWTPLTGSLPNLACTDGSYKKAVTSGIKLGVYNASPYMYQTNGKMAGLDWDINVAVLKYIGVKKVTPVMLQWPQMIPALVSKRIDVIAGDIHENPDRLKTIAFSTPAWWYGTTLMVPKANSKNVKTWADLQRNDIKVGAVTGSFAAEYLAGLSNPKVDLTLFQDAGAQFQGLAAGRVDVVVDDTPKEGTYIVSNPGANLKILSAALTNPPPAFQDRDARFAFRPADCTLNGAYSRALAELRDHGIVTKILKKYGLGDGVNLFMPSYKP
jgi:polar amino acid transport system substrate-binding protein